MADENTLSLSPNAKVLREARARFKRCVEWESVARQRFIEDQKFCYGDADNMYQWPVGLQDQRRDKPSLTINKTKQHCLQIINDARQNKTSVEIRAVGDGASQEAAKIYEGIVRHIEYISNAQAGYDTATWNQVVGGIGYLRLTTAYANNNSLDQEIFIRRVGNPLSIYLDPDIQEYDGSDARYGFVFKDTPRDLYEAVHPNSDEDPGDVALDGDDGGWATEDHVRECEYFRIVLDKDHLLALVDGTTVMESKTTVASMRAIAMAHAGVDDPDAAIAMDADGEQRRREISTSRVEWYQIAGDRIISKTQWAGRYIPIIRVVGEETVIGGQMDRRGHTRALKDPQRMYNYWSSSAVEHVALQTKVPWLASMESVGPYEEYFKNDNVENFAWLPWQETNEDGSKNTKPERIEPPVMAQAFMQGMQTAANEMMLVSGQYQAVMGAQSNETSGKAINARQRQGDNSTYHFIDHFSQAIRFLGKQLIDLIPKIYDTKRVVRIMAESGEESEVTIDPDAKLAHSSVASTPAPGSQGAPVSKPDVTVIFNPAIGEYDVEADIGPAYATRRQEAFDGMLQIMQANPDLMHVIGDLMFKASDMPMAEDIAERLHNMVPPQALGGPSPQMQQMQQESQMQAQKSQQMIGNLIQQLAEAKLEQKRQAAEQSARDADAQTKAAQAGGDIAGDAGRLEVDRYNAETQRLAAITKADPALAQMLYRQLWEQMQQTPIAPHMTRHAAFEQSLVPLPPEPTEGAPDGTASGE